MPSVISTNGVKGVAFLATSGGAGGTQYIGPIAPSAVTGGSPRTIEAWVYDAAPQGEKTVFIVSHRLSTVTRCDRLYRLDGGRIVQQGTPASLLAGAASA